jgi:phage N-6-adenine-methyltransferase
VAPKQKPGRSKQDYCTPPDFLEAVQKRLQEEFTWDLAASKENAIADHFYTEEDNSLIQDWSALAGWLWCNPPFGHIAPWVEKAACNSNDGAKIAMLVPASVGANWWLEWVDDIAYVLFLNGRLTFSGETTPYPKDCALLLYTPFIRRGYDIWSWSAK